MWSWWWGGGDDDSDDDNDGDNDEGNNHNYNIYHITSNHDNFRMQSKLPTLNKDSKVQGTSSSCTVEDGTSVASSTVKL